MKILSIGVVLLAIGHLSAVADDLLDDSALEQGKQLLESGAYKDAAKVLDKELKSLRAEGGGDTADAVHLLLAAAQAHAGMGKKSRGEANFDKVIEILKQPTSKDEADLIVEAFSVRWDTNFSWRDEKRLKQLTAIYGIAAQVLDDDDLRKVNMVTDLGTSLAGQALKEDALIYLDQAYAILTAARSVDPDPIGLELIELGIAYATVDRTETANELLNMATTIGTSTEAPITFVRVAPIYPAKCLSNNIRGAVRLKFRVGSSGYVHEVEETDVQYWRGRRKSAANNESCRSSLVRAATAAANGFRYFPRLENGLPVDSEGITTTITFEIE